MQDLCAGRAFVALAAASEPPHVSPSPTAPHGPLELLILIPALLLMLLYLALALRDLWVWMMNYNLPRADHCNENECGFHDVISTGAGSRHICRHPLVTRSSFAKHRKTGAQRGCRSSVQADLMGDQRPPAMDYVRDWLEHRSSFSDYGLFYKLITLAMLVALLLGGSVTLRSIISRMVGLD